MARLGLYLGSQRDDVSNIGNVLDAWIYTISEAGHEIDLVGGEGIPERLHDYCTIHSVADTHSSTPFGKIKNSYNHVSSYISNRQPDSVLQLWKYQTHAPGVAIAGKLCGVPTMARFTGDVFREYQGYSLPSSAGVFVLDNMIGTIPLLTVNKVVALGPYLKQSVLSRGVSESDVYIIPPPQPNEDRFFPAKSKGTTTVRSDLSDQHPVVLYVGRLTKQKGMPFLQKVIEGTLTTSNFQFVLIGEGPYRETFRNQFPPEKVLVPGFVPRSKIPQYYQAASVYIHPSQFEGIPLVILEALQSGVPVIARDAGDISFVLDDVVKTETQMIRKLVKREWNQTWQNKTYFSSEFQRYAINRVINDLLS